MKKNIYRVLLLLMIISPVSLFANDTWNEANTLYSEKHYGEAAALYEQLMSKGESAQLYYNYANACYKMGDLGKAVLNYERALKLEPNYEDAKANLAFVNSQITDKIEPIQHFFLAEWISALGRLLTSNQWAIISIITFVLALALLLTYLFARVRWLRKLSFFVGIAVFVVAIISASYSFSIKNTEIHHPSAIVMVGSASVRSAPDQSGTELFVLHEGTKITVKSRLGQWTEIRLPDGNVGWLLNSQFEII